MPTIKTKKYYINYHSESGVVILDMLEVYPEYRNTGIGTKAMLRFMKVNSGKEIELHAYPQDKGIQVGRLLEFYKSFGFREVAGCDIQGYEMNNFN